MLKKVLIWGAIAFIVFFVAFRPNSAREVVGTLGSTAVAIFEGIGNFFANLVS